MGLDINGTRFLLYAKTLGIDFTRTVMVGRQVLHLRRRDLKESFEDFGYVVEDELVDSLFTASGGFAEPLLTWLGARDVHSLDYSAYEGATHLHDMNKELPPGFKEQYTTVLDGGTLEHVFNFPVAIRNCMEMVRVGGHYLGITPANNVMGHGFYQFSPELYFSVFTRENGFKLLSVIAFEDLPRARWYAVRSPREVRDRVTLINKVPVFLLITAKRVAKAVIFETTPQQSDYLSAWHQRVDAAGNALTSIQPTTENVSTVDRIKEIVPERLRRPLRMLLWCFRSGFDSRFFQPKDPTTSTRSPNQLWK